jgi:hypothetical protein
MVGPATTGSTELASFEDRKVPELSYEAFKIHQVPQMKIVGSNFPIARKIAVLRGDATITGQTIPTRPTHVVITPAQVRQSASDTAPVTVELSVGTQVHLVENSAGWTLVARDGKNSDT